MQMKDLVRRLVDIKTEAEELRNAIEKDFDRGEIIGADLYQVEASVDRVMGEIMIDAYANGGLTFTDAGEPVEVT